MSTNLKPMTLGRQPESEKTRLAMLSRLGIVEEAKPLDTFQEPEPEPTPPVEALAAPPVQAPAAEWPTPTVKPRWVDPANDEQPEAAAEKPSLAIPAPPAEAEVEEDPFEAIRRHYLNPPKKTALPGNISLPTSLPPMPKVELKMAPVGERRRKAGELSVARKVIWGLSTLAALLIGWGLLTGDENSLIIQVFGVLLP